MAKIFGLILFFIVLPVVFSQHYESEPVSADSLLTEIYATEDISAFLDAYRKMQNDTIHSYSYDEENLNLLAERILLDGFVGEAIAMYQLNLEKFPDSWKAYEGLGEAFCSNGMMFQQAFGNYQKAMQLHPQQGAGTVAFQRMMGLRKSGMNETQDTLHFQPGEITGLYGPYLGQEFPGMKPKLFAPGIVSIKDNFELSCTFSNDGKELYYSSSGKIYCCRYEKNSWTAPEEIKFSGITGSVSEPYISRDGGTIYFNHKRSIWTAKRNGSQWNSSVLFQSGIYASTSNVGHVYFTDMSRMEENVNLVCVQTHDGKYGEAIILSDKLNTSYGEAHPCIAPDESYILFDSARPGGFGWSDFYVSFRNDDGTWDEAINLGPEINTSGNEIGMRISPDGRYLFFTRYNDIYWVDAEIIETVKPGDLKQEN